MEINFTTQVWSEGSRRAGKEGKMYVSYAKELDVSSPMDPEFGLW